MIFFEMATESQKNLARNDMYDARREAALERKLEAAQAQRIDELEQDIDAFEQERADMEAHIALTEWAESEYTP